MAVVEAVEAFVDVAGAGLHGHGQGVAAPVLRAHVHRVPAAAQPNHLLRCPPTRRDRGSRPERVRRRGRRRRVARHRQATCSTPSRLRSTTSTGCSERPRPRTTPAPSPLHTLVPFAMLLAYWEQTGRRRVARRRRRLRAARPPAAPGLGRRRRLADAGGRPAGRLDGVVLDTWSRPAPPRSRRRPVESELGATLAWVPREHGGPGLFVSVNGSADLDVGLGSLWRFNTKGISAGLFDALIWDSVDIGPQSADPAGQRALAARRGRAAAPRRSSFTIEPVTRHAAGPVRPQRLRHPPRDRPADRHRRPRRQPGRGRRRRQAERPRRAPRRRRRLRPLAAARERAAPRLRARRAPAVSLPSRTCAWKAAAGCRRRCRSTGRSAPPACNSSTSSSPPARRPPPAGCASRRHWPPAFASVRSTAGVDRVGFELTVDTEGGTPPHVGFKPPSGIGIVDRRLDRHRRRLPVPRSCQAPVRRRAAARLQGHHRCRPSGCSPRSSRRTSRLLAAGDDLRRLPADRPRPRLPPHRRRRRPRLPAHRRRRRPARRAQAGRARQRAVPRQPGPRRAAPRQRAGDAVPGPRRTSGWPARQRGSPGACRSSSPSSWRSSSSSTTRGGSSCWRSCAPTCHGEDAGAVVLRMDAIGVVDFDRNEVSFDAVLFDSRFGRSPVTGDMAVRGRYGEDPAFALAIGGLHPKFDPPAGFPQAGARHHRAEPGRCHQAHAAGVPGDHRQHRAGRRPSRHPVRGRRVQRRSAASASTPCSRSAVLVHRRPAGQGHREVARQDTARRDARPDAVRPVAVAGARQGDARAVVVLDVDLVRPHDRRRRAAGRAARRRPAADLVAALADPRNWSARSPDAGGHAARRARRRRRAAPPARRPRRQPAASSRSASRSTASARPRSPATVASTSPSSARDGSGAGRRGGRGPLRARAVPRPQRRREAAAAVVRADGRRRARRRRRPSRGAARTTRI